MMEEETKKRIELTAQSFTFVLDDESAANIALTGNHSGFSYVRRVYLEERIFWPNNGPDQFNAFAAKLNKKDFGTGLGKLWKPFYIRAFLVAKRS
jgi:hypothetical protein